MPNRNWAELNVKDVPPPPPRYAGWVEVTAGVVVAMLVLHHLA
ncbi:hypothetical protein [Actinoplanes sp. NPDC051859]